MIAPVSVARSIMNFGSNFSCAYQSTSASTRRPSASVLITSIVWPEKLFTTSPGRCAVPDEAHQTARIDFRLAAGKRGHQADHGPRPGHVPLHVFHAAGGFDADAAG